MYFLILCLSFSSTNGAEVILEASMIGDVVQAERRPTSVVATLCWTSHEILQLHSTLTDYNRGQISSIQFLKANDVPQRHSQDQHVVFIIDLGCSGVDTYLEKSGAALHFRSPFRWILIDNSADEEIVPSSLQNVDIFPDSEVMIARRVTNTSYSFFFTYKIGTGMSWRLEFYGTWDVHRRFQKHTDAPETTAVRRFNLERYEISICYVLTDNDSINHLDDRIDDHVDTITKANYPTTNHLLSFLNASGRYVFADTWGYNLNGTWNGLTGHLVREDVDIGGSPMFFTSERMSVVEYIAMPTPTRSKFVFQQPKLSYENNLFLLSFRPAVWYSSVALGFMLFIALFFVAKWEWRRTKQQMKDAGVLRPKIQDVGILLIGAICQQGSPVELKGDGVSVPACHIILGGEKVNFAKNYEPAEKRVVVVCEGSLGRTTMLILFLTLMFLYTSYSANIVALLQSSSSKIRTLDDLLHSRIKFGVHDNVFNRYYFSHATEPVRKAIYLQKVAPPGATPRFMTMEEGVKKMQKGLFAFHMEIGVGYKFVGKYFHEGEKCGLKEIQYLQVIDPFLAVRKHTPYKEMFKIGLKRIQEHGLQKRENEIFYEKRPKCSGRESNFVSVSMVDCYPALLVLSYGTVVAVLVLFLEILWKKRQRVTGCLKKAEKRNSWSN